MTQEHSQRHFGTDGVRGRVGVAPMTPEFVLKLGWAAGRVLASTPGARVLIGKDTRRSGYMLESALEAGLAAAGVEADLLGPIPTPAVAYLTRALRAQAGIVVSASHNPYHDNGVKFFSAEGGKLDDAVEMEIERLLDEPMECVASEHMGRARRIDDAAGRYIEYCKSTFRRSSLRGLKLVVDSANGAAYKVATAVFSELGADVITIGDRPDGFNINDACGSTHPQALMAAVREHHADVGIAVDGDADRCQMVTAEGRLVDGDEILLVIARRRRELGLLRGPVVGTQMSNFGLERAITAMGMAFERAAVGDRHVLARLVEKDGIVGGETSGHILCLDIGPTGDGIVTALQVLEAMQASGEILARLVAGMEKLPQVLVNVPITGDMRKLVASSAVHAAVVATERELGDGGRVLLRPSGTEPVVRVMVEATERQHAEQLAERLAACIRERAVAA
ncbi:MAG: phosphoglucosamine mutase [Nevskiaceae bacterium]|nr:MAG: phosphoglucosamine mutase [Nevskiaceae bacterium]TBR74142.1 MAG: phosphoglucosamine mutase [Nevskiaceae bacterium]